mgnify:CR=1 FL=1
MTCLPWKRSTWTPIPSWPGPHVIFSICGVLAVVLFIIRVGGQIGWYSVCASPTQQSTGEWPGEGWANIEIAEAAAEAIGLLQDRTSVARLKPLLADQRRTHVGDRRNPVVIGKIVRRHELDARGHTRSRGRR